MSHSLQSQSFTRKKRIKRWVSLVGALVALAVLVYVFSWITHMRFMTIADVSVFGADQEIAAEVQRQAQQTIEGSYLGIFSKKNTFLFPASDIVAHIQRSFPRVLDVTVDRDGLTKLRVAVSQKVPRAIVCASLPDFDRDAASLSGSEDCYFADETGYVFEKSPQFSGHPYNIYYIPDIGSSTSSESVIGRYATSTDEFAALQSLYEGARGAGVPVDGVLIKEKGEYEMYASGTIVYFNDEEGLSKERDNLIAFWRHAVVQSKSQKTPIVFDYIDLRYGSNVFYKMIK